MWILEALFLILDLVHSEVNAITAHSCENFFKVAESLVLENLHRESRDEGPVLPAHRTSFTDIYRVGVVAQADSCRKWARFVLEAFVHDTRKLRWKPS